MNEVVAHGDDGAPDSVELFNPGVAAIDLTGWSLTDDPGSSLKFAFAPGTVIGPGCTHFRVERAQAPQAAAACRAGAPLLSLR